MDVINLVGQFFIFAGLSLFGILVCITLAALCVTMGKLAIIIWRD